MLNLRVVHPVNVTDEHVSRVPKLIGRWGAASILYIGKWERDNKPGNLVEIDINTLYKLYGNDVKLPYDDDSFDHCICNNLHTITNPYGLADEIYRVITKELYVEAPFLTPYSTTKDDLYRFTPRGLTTLFNKFVVDELGVINGPGSTLHWIKTVYDALLFDRNAPIANIDKAMADNNYMEAYNIFAMHNEDIKDTDMVLNSREHACVIACSLYLMAHKESKDVE
jgi:ubiquinone/menaquinone biosynthesis C-methylase UbiE